VAYKNSTKAPIPPRKGVVARDCRQQTGYFIFVQRLGQTTRHLHAIDQCGRVVGAIALDGKVLVQHAHGRKLAGHRTRRPAVFA
jgi:hypothetical protein